MAIISEETTTFAVTPEDAKNWLTDHLFEYQRPVSQETIDSYAQQMRDNKWRVGDGTIILSSVGDQSYLTAGYHRLHALIQADIPVMMRVARQRFETYQDILDHYADGTNRNRNVARSAQLAVLGTAEATGLRAHLVRIAPTALVLIGNGFKTQLARSPAGRLILSSPTDMDRAIRDWSTPLFAYQKATDWQSYRENARGAWMRSPVVAIAALTYRFQPEKAEEFWTLTIRNDGLRANSPSAVLRDMLLNTTLESATIEKCCSKIASAWNHFMDGKEYVTRLQSVRSDDQGTITIRGTPFNGKPGFGDFDPMSLLRK